MVMALVPIPSHVKVELAQLKNLRDQELIDHYEITKDQINIYWTQIEKDQTLEIKLDRVVGWQPDNQCYEKPSVSYLYYKEEDKVWQFPAHI
jgi:hypothetical protein